MTDVQMNKLSDILPLVVKFLGIADANFPEGSKIAAGSPYTLSQVKKLIFQADYEIALWIVGNLEHTFRTFYVTEETDFLADGTLIPAHVGQHSKVTLKLGEDADAPEELGMFRDFARLKRLKRNPAIYGDPRNLYSIFGGRIHFVAPDTSGKLDIPKVTKDETLTNLITPLPYFWAVVAGAIASAGMKGFPESHRRYWGSIWQKYEFAIKGGAVAIPEPVAIPETEQLERIGT